MVGLVASFPFCQEYILDTNPQIYTAYRCATARLAQVSAPKLARITPTAVPAKHEFTSGEIAGLIIGVLVVVVMICMLGLRRMRLCIGLRIKRDRQGNLFVVKRAPPKPSKPIVDEKPASDANYNARLSRLTPEEMNVWVGFLSLYGEQGVPLGELVALVSALHCPLADIGGIYSNCSPDDECELTDAPECNTPILSLLKAVSCYERLVELEEKLVNLGVVVVQTEQVPVGSDRHRVIGTRSWCPGRRQDEVNIDAVEVCKHLILVYSHIPDRATHSLAERHRELFYWHAHLAIVYIYRMIRDERLKLDHWEGHFCDVALNVLSHRCQPGDDEIIVYIGYLLNKADSNPGPTASSIMYRALDHRQVNQLLYELIRFKTSPLRDRYQQARPKAQLFNQEFMELLYSVLKKPHACNSRTWGTAGYVLAELINAAEVAHDIEGMEQVAKLAKEWYSKTLLSECKKLAVLCYVLVKVQAFDELNKLPMEQHLACGYYLARSGFLQLAERFLASGLQYNEQERPDAPMWRYHLELWTVRMRQGQWEDAEHWLWGTLHASLTRADDLPAGEFDFWRLSGELEEFQLILLSLISDCYIAKGLYLQARDRIQALLMSIGLVRDTYISATRATLLSRLLNVQLHIEEPHSSAVTALQLCRELQGSTFLQFRWLDISWTVQEILGCANELSRVGLHRKAYVILRILQELDVDRFKSLGEDNSTNTYLSSVDLIAYIDQRSNEVGSMLGTEDPLKSQRPLSESLIDLTMQPLLFGILRNEDQPHLPNLPIEIPRPESRVRYAPYIFPAARSWTGAFSVQKPKCPVVQAPEHVKIEQEEENAPAGHQVQDSGGTASLDHRQVAKERKAAIRKRRRDNLRMLMKLRKPPSGIPSQPSAAEEGRLESVSRDEDLSFDPLRLPVGEMTQSSVIELQSPYSTHRWELSS